MNQKIISRLEWLKLKLVMFSTSHAYYASNFNLTDRAYNWVTQYDKIREQFPQEWKGYCEKVGACETHNARDLLA